MYQRIAFIIVVVSGAAILAYCAADDILGKKVKVLVFPQCVYV